MGQEGAVEIGVLDAVSMGQVVKGGTIQSTAHPHGAGRGIELDHGDAAVGIGGEHAGRLESQGGLARPPVLGIKGNPARAVARREEPSRWRCRCGNAGAQAEACVQVYPAVERSSGDVAPGQHHASKYQETAEGHAHEDVEVTGEDSPARHRKDHQVKKMGCTEAQRHPVFCIQSLRCACPFHDRTPGK
ncbi:MAG: hypothetical protein NVSMB17_11580 [Candidatus Dormibacteria bacterium]